MPGKDWDGDGYYFSGIQSYSTQLTKIQNILYWVKFEYIIFQFEMGLSKKFANRVKSKYQLEDT